MICFEVYLSWLVSVHACSITSAEGLRIDKAYLTRMNKYAANKTFLMGGGKI